MFKGDARENLQAALQLHQAGQLDKAGRLYRHILNTDPGNAQALHYLGVLEASTGHYDRAKSLLARSVAVQPGNVAFLENYATIMVQSGDYAAALDACERGLQLAGASVSLLYVGAVALFKLKRLAESLAQFDKVLALQPNHVPAINERGSVLAEMAKFDDALASFQKALALAPAYGDAHVNCGNLYAQLNNHEAAFAAYDRALACNPGLADAWLGRGNLFVQRKRYADALAAYDRALALKPVSALAWVGRGNALFELRRHADAFAAFDRACAIDPDCPYALGRRLEAKMRVCDWSGFAAECADVLAAVERAVPVAPFVLLAVPASARTQLQCAERFVKTRHPPAERPLWRGERYHNDRVRLAYLSADLRDHPVGYLTAGLFERHDKARFEVTALSVAGVPASSHVSRRISDAVERFVDVSSTSDEALADLIRQLKIDIVVDLGGFTTDGRLGVLAWRPAPVQVNYLGYIGTTGAAFIDYVIADKIALPFDQQPYFAEKIVHLPDCFVVTDDRVEAAALTPSRQQAGLPADGFVFCCFNNSYKLNGPLFERWTRLLRAVEGSVLWLAEASAEMAGNLRREAARCRIDPERLIFAPRLPHSEHLARQRLADLFLDTVPYNAGATAVAALWSGVPLVTLSGETFVSRMAASMLHAVGMPDLMTSNLDEYETLALKLAQNPNLLADARYRLQQNLPRKPLFDTDRFRRHLEAAFITMWQRAERGEPPQSFAVGAIGTERVH